MIMNSLIKKTSVQIIIIAIFIIVGALSARAQSPTELNVRITPGEPRAREEVTATLTSTSVNLATARVLWTINGARAMEGAGLTQFTFRVGALGSVSRVGVFVTTPLGETIERTFEIRPAEVDLLYEAITYTPPFYAGKALPTSKSKIKMLAVPHFISENGKRISEETLIYTWQQDRRILGSLSGTGKNTILIETPRPLQETHIVVSVSSGDGIRNARSEIVISAKNPEVILYEKHPTLGVRYGSALTPEITLTEEEITVRAEPYFFSAEDVASGNLRFAWSLNESLITPPLRIDEISFRKNGGAGTAQLTLGIENVAKILQSAAEKLLIRF